MSFSPISAQSRRDRVLLRLGGIGALCALVVLVLGLAWGMFAPDEPTSELFILTTLSSVARMCPMSVTNTAQIHCRQRRPIVSLADPIIPFR